MRALGSARLDRFVGQMLTGQYRDASAGDIDRDRDPCRGARAFKHDHSFTETGEFASYDDTGQQVDEGTYTVKGNELTVSRPPIDVTVGFSVSGDTASFDAIIPDTCETRRCRDAALLSIGTFFPPSYQRVG